MRSFLLFTVVLFVCMMGGVANAHQGYFGVNDIVWNFRSGQLTPEQPGDSALRLLGTANWQTAPPEGRALLFESGRDYLQSASTFNLRSFFSVTCRVKLAPGREKMSRVLLSKGNRLGDPSHFRLETDSLTGYLRFISPGLTGDVSSGVAIDDDKWYFIAVTYSYGWLKYYVDGVLMRACKVNGEVKPSEDVVTIGALPDGSCYLAGSMSALRITAGRVWTGVQVRDQFEIRQAGWNLDEGMGRATFNDTGNVEYGLLNGPMNVSFNYGTRNTGWLSEANWVNDPIMGTVLNFQKESAHVKVDSASQIKPGSHFSIIGWILPVDTTDRLRIVLAKGEDIQSPAYFDVRLMPVTGELALYAPAMGGVVSSNRRLQTGKWYHFAVVYDGEEMIFYLNRQRIAVRKVSGSLLGDESPLYIGSGALGVNTCGGNLSRIRFFGRALRQHQIADYYRELPVVAWKFTEGEGDSIIDQGSGLVGHLHGAVWKAASGISFSSALSFNQLGARVIADEKGMVSLGNRFTISAWMRRNRQMEEPGVILCRGDIGKKGHFRLQVEPQSGLLTLYAPDLGGKISTGIAVLDTIWHHIMVSYGEGVMRFYLDRQVVKTAAVKGGIRAGKTLLSIGALPDGKNVAGAMLAEVMIYNSVRLPEEVTSIVPPAGPRLNLKKGIVFDRIQNTTFPVKKEWQISDNDIEVARSMGFDHIKILLTADKYIQGASLNTAHMYYVDQVVNTALASGLPCVVTLHPEPQFKQRYLGTDTGFVQMLQFYRDFARYLADRWGPDKVAFTLMTEPWGNPPGTDWGKWSYMWPKMYSVVRKEMPDHTLVLSGDRAGNIYAMTEMVPVDDKNVYYSFTTYEPYRFGFSTMFGGWRGQFDFWKDMSYIPWPSSQEIVSARMDSILINVKPEHKTEARKAIQDYGEASFNRVWWMMRVRGVKEWNDAFGGNLHVLVAEFGALDHMKSRSNGASNGVYPHERINYIRDMRESFESVGMGWEYWSFNEYFTVFDPEVREPYGVVNEHMVDNDLLRALGLQH